MVPDEPEAQIVHGVEIKAKAKHISTLAISLAKVFTFVFEFTRNFLIENVIISPSLLTLVQEASMRASNPGRARSSAGYFLKLRRRRF